MTCHKIIDQRLSHCDIDTSRPTITLDAAYDTDGTLALTPREDAETVYRALTGALNQREDTTVPKALTRANIDVVVYTPIRTHLPAAWLPGFERELITGEIIPRVQATCDRYGARLHTLSAVINVPMSGADTIGLDKTNPVTRLSLTDLSQNSDTRDTVESSQLDAMVSLLGRFVEGERNTEGERIGTYGIGCNIAEDYVNDTFALRDFCWCEGRLHPSVEDEDYGSSCPPNFEFFSRPGSPLPHITGHWYKYMGRGNRFSTDVDAATLRAILAEGLRSLDADDHTASAPLQGD